MRPNINPRFIRILYLIESVANMIIYVMNDANVKKYC